MQRQMPLPFPHRSCLSQGQSHEPSRNALQLTILYQHRRSINLLAARDIINRRENRDATEHSHIPIHRLAIDRPPRGEEAEDKEGNQERQGDHVHRHPPLAE